MLLWFEGVVVLFWGKCNIGNAVMGLNAMGVLRRSFGVFLRNIIIIIIGYILL